MKQYSHARSWVKSYSAKRFLELFPARGEDVRESGLV